MSQSTKKASLPYSIFELAIAVSFVLFRELCSSITLQGASTLALAIWERVDHSCSLLVVLTVWLLESREDLVSVFYGWDARLLWPGAVWHELLHAKAQATPDGSKYRAASDQHRGGSGTGRGGGAGSNPVQKRRGRQHR